MPKGHAKTKMSPAEILADPYALDAAIKEATREAAARGPGNAKARPTAPKPRPRRRKKAA
ncbi:MAG: hypothetical protein K2Q20_09705 [Phycisphaerales bacterium]|nr:hypothetical protein [Phycisphaerales bacterium]